jgi:hypothetical protein
MANCAADPAVPPISRPYRGKLTVPNFTGGDGNVGTIRSPVGDIALPDRSKMVTKGDTLLKNDHPVFRSASPALRTRTAPAASWFPARLPRRPGPVCSRPRGGPRGASCLGQTHTITRQRDWQARTGSSKLHVNQIAGPKADLTPFLD